MMSVISAIEAGTGAGLAVLGFSFGSRVKLVRLTPEPKPFSDNKPRHAIPNPTSDRASSAHYAGPNCDAHSHFVARKCGLLRVRSAVACVRRFSDATSPSTDDLWTRLDGAVAKVSLSGQAKL